LSPRHARFSAVEIFFIRKFLRTRLQPIRTASEVSVKIIIQPLQRTPLYQKVAKKVEELSLLGMSNREIAKSLNIGRNTVRNAYKLLSGPLRAERSNPKEKDKNDLAI